MIATALAIAASGGCEAISGPPDHSRVTNEDLTFEAHVLDDTVGVWILGERFLGHIVEIAVVGRADPIVLLHHCRVTTDTTVNFELVVVTAEPVDSNARVQSAVQEDLLRSCGYGIGLPPGISHHGFTIVAAEGRVRLRLPYGLFLEDRGRWIESDDVVIPSAAK